MVDYYKDTGSSGKMMIRDNGSIVEFWLNSNNGTTWDASLPWGYTVNGGSANLTYNYPAGAGWRRLGFWTVTTNQTVQFRIGNTGTGGFGGPTTFNQAISRSGIPPAPQTPVASSISQTYMYLAAFNNGDGGSAILEWQIAWGTDSTGAVASYADNPVGLTGLSPGTTYYFWSRVRNAYGWSNWSARGNATTLVAPPSPSITFVHSITQTGMTVVFVPNETGGQPIISYEIGYATSSSAPTTTMAATSPHAITGLSPGTTYYLFVRAESAAGWGPWSTPTPAKTIAGARVKVEAVWHDAVPYVKDAGTWKLARPYGRIAGEWKEAL